MNGMRYIGRCAISRPGYLGSGVRLKRAVAQFGKQNFISVKLQHCQTIAELKRAEVHWMSLFKAWARPNEFYNISQSQGGMSHGDHHTEKTKRLISARCKGKRLTLVQRKRLAKASRGRVPFNKGKRFDKMSPEYAKIYLAKKKTAHLTLDLKKQVIEEAKKGVPFIDLSAKYGRRINSAIIQLYAKKIQKEAST